MVFEDSLGATMVLIESWKELAQRCFWKEGGRDQAVSHYSFLSKQEERDQSIGNRMSPYQAECPKHG